MQYVQKYLGNQTLVVSAAPEITQALNIPDPYGNITFVAQTAGGNKFKEGDVIQFIVQAFDEKGNLLNRPEFKESVTVSL